VETAVAQNRVWFAILGICLIILGIIAIWFPVFTTVAAKVFLGWLFLIGGIIQIVHAFSTQTWSAFFFDLVIGVLYVLVGLWLAFFPLTGVLTLTVLIAALFIIEGILELGMAARTRPYEGWVWMLIAGILAIIVGLILLANLPGSALWALGLLVGVKMIVAGWAYLALALAAGRSHLAGRSPGP
jgi:uncharacterized membrane protein HdeD (DUF308 family)